MRVQGEKAAAKTNGPTSPSNFSLLHETRVGLWGIGFFLFFFFHRVCLQFRPRPPGLGVGLLTTVAWRRSRRGPPVPFFLAFSLWRMFPDQAPSSDVPGVHSRSFCHLCWVLCALGNWEKSYTAQFLSVLFLSLSSPFLLHPFEPSSTSSFNLWIHSPPQRQ